MDVEQTERERFGPRMKHWTEAQARELLGAVDRSGLSRRAFARSQHISENRLKYWARRLKWPPPGEAAGVEARGGTGASFVEVTVVSEPSASPTAPQACQPLEVILDARRRVVVPVGFDAPTLERLLNVLDRRRGC